jgi:hypothetical protein
MFAKQFLQMKICKRLQTFKLAKIGRYLQSFANVCKENRL